MAQLQQSLLSQFRLTRSDTVDEGYINRLLAAIDAGMADIIAAKRTFEEVQAEILQLGLDRINDLLVPAAERLTAVANLGFLIASSQTSRTLVAGQTVNLTVGVGPQRDLFTPSPIVILTREGSADDYAVVRTLTYDPTIGDFLGQVLTVWGSPGPHNDWTIGSIAGSALATYSAMNSALAALASAELARDAAQAARDAAQGFRDTAGGHASTATTKAAEALASAQAAADRLADFNARYYGPRTTAPAGAAVGSQYLNTASTPNTMMVLTGTGWNPTVSVSIGGRRTQDYPLAAYAAGATYAVDGGFSTGDVLIGGVLQREGAGITLSPGPSGSFTIARAVGNTEAVSFRGFLANDAVDIYTKAEANSTFATPAQLASTAAGIVADAPVPLNTLDKLAAAMNDDPAFAVTVLTAIANRIRYDAAMALTGPQKALALANIGAQAALGFLPVEQGGGPRQSANKLKLGWTGAALALAVDGADLGDILTAGNNVDLFMANILKNSGDALTARGFLKAQENLGWKPCVGFPYRPTVDVGGVIIPMAANSKSMRITGFMKPSILSAFGFLRLSYDGGATYKAAANDYACSLFYQIEDAITALATADASYFNGMANANDAVILSSFDIQIDYNLGYWTKLRMTTSGITLAGKSTYQTSHGWCKSSAVPTHAILQLSEGAAFTPATNIMAECF